MVVDELTFLKHSCAHYPIAITSYLKAIRQGIHSLRTHTIQSDGLLESLRVVLTTRVQDAHSLDHLSLWDASTVVTHRHSLVLNHLHLDALAGIHLELIDTVVDNLLEQHIDAVLCMAAIAQTTDVHTRTQTDVLHTCQGDDVGIIIIGFWGII